MNKNTKFSNNFSLKNIIILIIVVVLIFAAFKWIWNLVGRIPVGNTGGHIKTIILFPLVILMEFLIYGLVALIAGYLKGKKKAYYENKKIDTSNNYIYYRELPNNLGIGVNTLLLDSTLENYKDIVAVILDLCARKYLNLIKQNEKYTVKVLKPIDDELLLNEKYIMNLLINNSISNIDYKAWFNCCVNDGVNLGVYYKREFEPVQPNSDGIVPLMDAMASIGYKGALENNLVRTEKGIEEYQKLQSFKKFLEDFGHYDPKQAEEIGLWDRYLSYAQLFGLTNELMKTGHKQLVENASFVIDNFDNITLSNIEVLTIENDSEPIV